MNLPALLVILAVSTLLVIGIRESARVNAVIVALKLGVILFVIVAGFSHVDPSNWRPFAPFGWSGVMAGGAIVFFSYIGFDCVTTAAEESRRPERDMPIGILGSLAICTLLYLAVSAVVTGMVPLSQIHKAAPIAKAFSDVGMGFAAGLISMGAIVGLTSVLLVLLLGQSRIFMAMSRDGLMPKLFGKVHPRFRTPHVSTIIVGVIVAVLSGLTPLTVLVELVSIGTLFAFVLVSAGVLVLRRTQPGLRRPFRCPWVPVVPLLAIASCGYLMASLPGVTWLRFGVWLLIGLALYAFYGRRHSRLATLGLGLFDLGHALAPRHQDLPGAHQVGQLEGAEQPDEGVELLARAVRLEHQRVAAVVDHARRVVLRDLQDLGALVERALELHQRDLDLVRRIAGVIDGVHHVDQLLELLDDLLEVLRGARAGDRHAREAPLGGRAHHQALDVEAAPREDQRHAHQHAGLVVHEQRDRVERGPLGRDRGRRRPSCGSPPQVLPVGFSSRRLGFSINISLIAAPAGIIGKTLSSFTTSATTTQGPAS